MRPTLPDSTRTAKNGPRAALPPWRPTPRVCLAALAGLLAGPVPGRAASARPFPAWQHLSSARGELPVPAGGREQTSLLVFDLDRDGRNDLVVAERTSAPAVVWFRRGDAGWTQHVLEPGRVPVAAGGTFGDVDGDGDPDLVLGSSGQGSHVWWWENPGPQGDPTQPWSRRSITESQKGQHHDQITGDFRGTGHLDVVAWFQGGGELSLYRPPPDPRARTPWEIFTIATGLKQAEGLARGDIDGDGRPDIVGGGRWFKHLGGGRFAAHLIDAAQTSGRAEVGDLVKGGRPEVVMVIGDGVGRLKWYACDGDPAQPGSWRAHDLLDRDVIRGHSLQIADIDGDGHTDIFCAEMAAWGRTAANPQAKAWIFYGDSRGHFTRTELATGIDFHEAKVADLDGDGRPDVANKPFMWQTPRLDVWLNRGVASAPPNSSQSTK